MSNIFDYITWRGDLTFEVDPLNEVDGLIFSQLAYLPFDGILMEGWTNALTVEEAGKQYFELFSKRKISAMPVLLRNCSRLLKAVMEAERYKNLQLTNYVARFDPVSSKQFGAMVILLDRRNGFVAFRGTDDTLAGWEEDFKLSYMCPVASQVEAVQYLVEVMENFRGELALGGHSKGGNLAIYSAMKLPPKAKKRILTIFNYDGPGFLEAVINTQEYQNTAEKVISFMPQGSIVGMILFHDEEYKIIQSNEKSFYQHTAVSWEVEGRYFKGQGDFKNSSLIFNDANKAWMNEISIEQRALFIEVIFKVLRSGKVDTVSGMKEDLLSSANSIIKSYNGLDKTTRKLVKNIVSQMIKLSTRTITENMKRQKSAEFIEEK